METYLGPEHLPKHRIIQNGDPRDSKKLPTGRGVGHLHRLQGRIFPYTNSQSVQEVHAFHIQGRSYQFKALSFGLSTAPVEFTVVAKEVKFDGSAEGYKNPPVTRRLVGESHVPPNLSPAYTDLGSSLSRSRLAGEQGKIRTGSITGFQLRRLPVRP